MTILLCAAEFADQRAAKIAQTISSESGKTITEATGEAARSGDLIRLAAFEGTQLYGEPLPLDAHRGTGQDKVGCTPRQSCGVVVAITPFNYPALLVLHELAPALAAGNAVVLEPATSTPLTALELAECFVDAGLPEGVLSMLVGSGAVLGAPS
ncbi:aldehyde dehydrogenase family protein [Streptomyces mirabilis]|uniref:aldehyde dehydrogenase family protein n=1 Tax=Streptomyces mirabilis TaxID=68239 RepID=UPI00331E4617